MYGMGVQGSTLGSTLRWGVKLVEFRMYSNLYSNRRLVRKRQTLFVRIVFKHGKYEM